MFVPRKRITISREEYLKLNIKETKEKDIDENANDTIYFIFDSVGCVKIGVTNNVAKRMKLIQCGNSHPLLLYKTIKVKNNLLLDYSRNQMANSCNIRRMDYLHPTIESRIHKVFKKYRRNGEWFDLTPILKKFIDNATMDNVENLLSEMHPLVKKDKYVPAKNQLSMNVLTICNKQIEDLENKLKDLQEYSQSLEEKLRLIYYTKFPFKSESEMVQFEERFIQQKTINPQ